MGGSPQSLSSQDIQDLQEISSRLPQGHPMIAKISTLLNSHGQQYDLTTAAQDPDFLRADMKDKISFLAAHDSDFAAANPKDQMDYLNHIIPTGQKFQAEHSPSPSDTGVWNRTKQFGSDLGHMALGLAGSGLGAPVVTPGKVADAAAGYSARRAAGRSPLYSGIATGAEAAGIDPTGMEASAEHGDPVGVGVHAAAQLAPVVAGEAARIPAVRKGVARLAAPIRELRTPISDTATAAKSAIGDVLVDEMGRPKTIPRLVLGNERATALGELAKPEIAERQGAQEIRAASRPWLKSRGAK